MEISRDEQPDQREITMTTTMNIEPKREIIHGLMESRANLAKAISNALVVEPKREKVNGRQPEQRVVTLTNYRNIAPKSVILHRPMDIQPNEILNIEPKREIINGSQPEQRIVTMTNTINIAPTSVILYTPMDIQPNETLKNEPKREIINGEWHTQREIMITNTMDIEPEREINRDHAYNNKKEGSMPYEMSDETPPAEQTDKRTTCVMSVGPTNDDNILYCEDCKQEHKEHCPIHGPLVVVQNMKVEENNPDRALHSLPTNLLVKESDIDGAGLGVFTDAEIPPGTTYGPYEGMYTTDPELAGASGYCWQIYNKDGVPSNFIDGKDTASSNWMRYVNCALSKSDQNLVAFQYKGDIYYRCIKPILPKTELLVWYGDDCARMLGINRKRTTHLTTNLDVSEDFALPTTGGRASLKDSASHVGPAVGTDADTHERIEAGTKLYEGQTVNHTVNRHARNNKGDQPLKYTVYNTTFFEQPHKNTYFKCKYCDKEFTFDIDLYNHMRRVHTGERRYRCDKCGKPYKDKLSLKRHVLKHKEMKSFTCELYDKRYQSSSALTQHLLTHTAEECYRCITCEKLFQSESQLQLHLLTHTTGKYKCEHCHKVFEFQSHLKQHSMSHTVNKPYACEVYNKRFNHEDSLKIHLLIHKYKAFKCKYCDKALSSNASLQTHMRVHTGEKPYQCNVCSKAFSHKSSLHAHLFKHSGEKPFPCELCDKTFVYNSLLQEHLKTHKDVKPYKCDKCDKSFKSKTGLKVHAMEHAVEKHYQCKVCSEIFEQRSTVEEHMKIHKADFCYGKGIQSVYVPQDDTTT